MLKWMIKEDYYDIERLRHFYHENLDEHLALHSIKVPKMFRVPRSPNSREELIQELLQKKKKKKKKKLQSILETIHSDVIGPIQSSFTRKI